VTESAKLEVKSGLLVEGSRQLLEVTTYGLRGNRIENVSYTTVNSTVGKEEYKYDDKGNIIEMTLRDDSGLLLSREAYDYEFDRFGNWTKMVTNLLVFEAGKLKQEPTEATYRTLTYYFDDQIAKIVDSDSNQDVSATPASIGSRVSNEGRTESAPNSLTNGDTPANSLETSKDQPYKTTKKGKTISPESDENGVRDGSGSQAALLESSSTSLNRPVGEAANASVIAPRNPPATGSATSKTALDYYKPGSERFDAGDLNGAVEAYLQSIELEPNSPELYLSLGQAYLKLRKDKDAVKALKESIRLNPEVAESQYGLGLAYFRTGRNKEAAAAFKRATLLSPDMAKAHYGLALAYQELGKQDGLIEEYRILENLDRKLAKQLAQAFPDSNLPCSVQSNCK